MQVMQAEDSRSRSARDARNDVRKNCSKLRKSVSFSGFERTLIRNPAAGAAKPPGRPEAERTLTTAQAIRENEDRLQSNGRRESVEHTKIIGLRIKRRKNQATKSTGWMPWHHQPKKDVASCEKLRGAASKHRSADIRMGKPGKGRPCHRKVNS